MVCRERLSEVAWLDLEGRRLRRDPGDGLQWGLTEEVQPGSSFSLDEHGGEEKSFRDRLELVRPVLRWKGVVPVTRVTFRRNRRHCRCLLPCHRFSSRAVP